MTLDVPDEVRNKVLAEGNGAWLEELPSIVASVADNWSLLIGGTLRGGHAALVVETTLPDGSAAVLKVGVPGTEHNLELEAKALQLVDGDGCARLLRADLARGALLLERLGAQMYDLVPDCAARHDLLCDLASRFWRPIPPDVVLETGAERASMYAELLVRWWNETGQACTRAALDDALECAHRREQAHDHVRSVLVHGDVHHGNALLASDGTFKLIDPDGVRAEPAYDLGTIVRCDPELGDDLRARTDRLSARTGVDPTAIWEWGTVHRVVSGLYCRLIGFQPFGDQLLTEADRLTS